MSIKRELITGTFILTGAGLIARIFGLLHRIYLANLISNVELGRYQLIFPIFMFCMALSSSGISVAVSKLVSELLVSDGKREIQATMTISLLISFALACLCSLVLYFNATAISLSILKELGCEKYLKILALAIPFAAMHGCVSGYFYGCKKTGVPAFSQLVEQMIRLLCIYFLANYMNHQQSLDADIALWALTFGEIASFFVTWTAYKISICHQRNQYASSVLFRNIVQKLWRYGAILTVNRVSVTLLQAVEMILIPMMLTRYMAKSDAALALFGVITGIVLPIILFPSTVTNSFSLLLLSSISEAEAANDYRTIGETFSKSIRLCWMMSLFAGLIFAVYGKDIGSVLFQSEIAGAYIRIFSIVCPLFYVQTLLASTLNGLGKMNETLMHHVLASAVRLISILYLVPRIGIVGYVIGIFLANLLVTILAVRKIYNITGVVIPFLSDGIVVVLGAVCSTQLSMFLGQFSFFSHLPGNAACWRLIWQCGMMGIIYMGSVLGIFMYRLKKR